MTDALVLASSEELADLGTYATRARALDPQGAMRLHAHGTVLAAWVGVRRGRGILGEGTILGMRAVALAEPSDVDLTVPLSAVTDRTARRDGARLPLPPVTVDAPWAALTPPRAGWTVTAEPVEADVAAAARALGFVRPGEAPTAYAAGQWRRLSAAGGHVLSRPAGSS